LTRNILQPDSIHFGAGHWWLTSKKILVWWLVKSGGGDRYIFGFLVWESKIDGYFIPVNNTFGGFFTGFLNQTAEWKSSLFNQPGGGRGFSGCTAGRDHGIQFPCVYCLINQTKSFEDLAGSAPQVVNFPFLCGDAVIRSANKLPV
jgi:hypothetical protein